MASRAIAVAVACLVLAGCRNDPMLSALAPPSALGAVEHDPAKKTMASKVLGAIALERVTGRKPDPSRLNELN